MKKLYFVFLGLVIIASSALMVFLLRMDPKSSEINDTVQAWLEENIKDAEQLQFEVIFETSSNIRTVVNGKKDDRLEPDDIPLYIAETYQVSLIKSGYKARIEHTQTVNWYKDESKSKTETYSDRIYYMAIPDGKVEVYYPENNTYTMRSIDNSEFADAVSALLFPTDVGYLYDKSPIQVIVETEGYPHYNVYRNVDTTYFYAPFAILRGDKAEDVANNNTTVGFYLNDQPVLPKDMYRMCFWIVNVNTLYPYAYEAWTGNTYENVFKKNGYSYSQDININLYDGFNEAEAFNLPTYE